MLKFPMSRPSINSAFPAPWRALAVVIVAGMAAGTTFAAPITEADYNGLNLGTAANYGIVDLGSTTLGMNSGPVVGNVLVGNGLTVQLSGGNNGGITGNLYYDSTAHISGALQNPITESLVSTSVTQAALISAENVASFAKSLAVTPTTTVTGNFNNQATKITGNGGLNVIDVASIQNAPLTISGNANDYFVINISGEYQTNQPMTLIGVTAAQILFNFTGTGTVFSTSGGDQNLYGTFLAAKGGSMDIQKDTFSNLDVYGALIDTDGDMQFVSGSKLNYTGQKIPFAGVPDGASTVALLGGALVGLAALRRRFGPAVSRN